MVIAHHDWILPSNILLYSLQGTLVPFPFIMSGSSWSLLSLGTMYDVVVFSVRILFGFFFFFLCNN